MVATMFAGCGSSNGSNGTEKADKKDGGKETITVMGPSEDLDDAKGAWLKTECEAFAKANPDFNIEFKYVTTSEGDAKDVVTKDPKAAADVCFNTRGPVAAIFYQGHARLADGQNLEEVEKAIVSYGGVEASKMEQNLSWISLFIAIAPSLGFLGTVIGMIQAFDAIMVAGDMSPAVVAGGMKVALITTVGGLIVAVILQIFYNYILSQVEALTVEMEDASISLMDILVKYQK